MAGSSSRASAASLMVSGREITVNDDGCDVDDLSFCGAVSVTLPAEARWDDFVALAVEQEWVGVEALSGLPGTIGEVVTAGSAAYGQSVGETVASVRTWDETIDRQRTFAAADCEFAAGSSRFSDGDRYRVLDVTFLLRQGDLTRPITDAALTGLLGIEPGQRAPLTAVREALT